ncbi:MAG: efflux transporter outer membrane subunit [Burkholderiaceae bacterium]
MTFTIRLLPLAAALVLAGCGTLAPTYERPAAPVAQAWPQGPAYAAESTAAATLPAWQDFFTDAKLRQVIELALANNRDLRIAALNIEQARAQYRISRAALLPNASANADGNHNRSVYGNSSTGQRADQANLNHSYSASIGVGYELDLFGKIRSGNEVALNQFFATEEARRSVELSLVASVADTWLLLAAGQAQVALAKTTLASQEASYGLTARSHELGVASALDLNQARTTVESARVELARSTRAVAQVRNALALLAGGAVDQSLEPAPGAVAASVVPELPAGVPSEVLLQRPDIAQAERLLRAANAQIGVARAAFFPSISLSAGGGRSSADLTELFSGGASYAWSWVPSISVPIFTGGALTAQLESTRATREIALASYEKSIQTAFREVADALATRGTIDAELEAQAALAKAATAAYDLSEKRFRGGLDNYLAVLVAQRQMVVAQQALIQVEQTRASSLVQLYKALGGGVNQAAS